MESIKNQKPILKVPNDKKVRETESATLWLEDNILYTVAKKKRRNTENISEMPEKFNRLANGRKVFLIADLTFIQTYSAEEKSYLKEGLFPALKAIAILSASPMGKMPGHAIFMKEFPGIPVREFACVEDAEAWIKTLKYS